MSVQADPARQLEEVPIGSRGKWVEVVFLYTCEIANVEAVEDPNRRALGWHRLIRQARRHGRRQEFGMRRDPWWRPRSQSRVRRPACCAARPRRTGRARRPRHRATRSSARSGDSGEPGEHERRREVAASLLDTIAAARRLTRSDPTAQARLARGERNVRAVLRELDREGAGSC